jgi:hypothetical protein
MNDRARGQSGSTLILVVGVIAALAIMASGLVILTANVQSNTAKQRTRTKAFDVAEGALDMGMHDLSASWPKKGGTAVTWDATSFRSLGQFADAAEYPDPKTGSFTDVQFYDDDAAGGGYSTSSAHTDENNNEMMWVVAKGATGTQRSAVQAKVHRNPVPTNFPHGIALFVGGTLANNAPGQTKKGMVHIEDQGTAGAVNGYATAFGGKSDAQIFDTGITPHVVTPAVGDATVPPIDSLIPQSIINQIIILAQKMGTYYDVTEGDSIPADKSGICVIKVANGTSVPLGNGHINTEASPGILLVLGGNAVTIDMSGNGEFWGVIYTTGICDTAHGTPSVHGMMVCASDLTMKGTPDIYYNDSVITTLSNMWTLTVSLVVNTWREIKP